MIYLIFICFYKILIYFSVLWFKLFIWRVCFDKCNCVGWIGCGICGVIVIKVVFCCFIVFWKCEDGIKRVSNCVKVIIDII